MKKIAVSNACVMCGACYNRSDLVKSDGTGKAVPSENCAVTADREDEAKSIVNICLAQAISIVEA